VKESSSSSGSSTNRKKKPSSTLDEAHLRDKYPALKGR
jgi:hypothetical protein